MPANTLITLPAAFFNSVEGIKTYFDCVFDPIVNLGELASDYSTCIKTIDEIENTFTATIFLNNNGQLKLSFSSIPGLGFCCSVYLKKPIVQDSSKLHAFFKQLNAVALVADNAQEQDSALLEHMHSLFCALLEKKLNLLLTVVHQATNLGLTIRNVTQRAFIVINVPGSCEYKEAIANAFFHTKNPVHPTTGSVFVELQEGNWQRFIQVFVASHIPELPVVEKDLKNFCNKQSNSDVFLKNNLNGNVYSEDPNNAMTKLINPVASVQQSSTSLDFLPPLEDCVSVALKLIHSEASQ